MRVSALEILLGTERIQQQTTEKAKVGFARPVLCEMEIGNDGPFLATNLRNSFLPTRRSDNGTVRFAFTECPIGQEGSLLNELYEVLWKTSVQYDWPNRCTSISEARTRMVTLGMEPKAVILGLLDLEKTIGAITEDDADKLMLTQGHIAEVGGIKALAADLLPGRAILSSTPSQVGHYVRSGDHLGILICQADRSLILVGDE